MSGETPTERDTVFVTVGRDFDIEDRAVVRATVTSVKDNGEFMIKHDEILREGWDEYKDKKFVPAVGAQSGYYGREPNEYGRIWAFKRQELPV